MKTKQLDLALIMRKKLIARLFMLSQGFYTRWFKKQKEPWGITKTELLAYPFGSLGLGLGQFLERNNFDLIPKVERHDAYHVLLNFGIKEEDEIALQYLCLGNGKHSAYLAAVITIGTIVLPEYMRYYLRCYKVGKRLNTFYNLNYFPLLYADLETLRHTICTQEQLEELNTMTHE